MVHIVWSDLVIRPASVPSGKCSTQMVTSRQTAYDSVVLMKDAGVIQGLPIDDQ